MNGLSNSRYEELLAILEQQEEEKERSKEYQLQLEKELEGQLSLNGEMASEILKLEERQKGLMEELKSLHGEVLTVREENRQLDRRLESLRKANTELRDQSIRERKRLDSDCSTLREELKLQETKNREVKGVLLAALLYSILVTSFQAIKDGALLLEIKEGSVILRIMMCSGIKSMLAVGEEAALQSQMRTTGHMQVVSYYLTKVSVCLFISSLVVVPSMLLLRKIYRFYRKRMVNLTVLTATAVSLALVVWFGTMIQKVIPISEIEMLVQTQLAMALSREEFKEGIVRKEGKAINV